MVHPVVVSGNCNGKRTDPCKRHFRDRLRRIISKADIFTFTEVIGSPEKLHKVWAKSVPSFARDFGNGLVFNTELNKKNNNSKRRNVIYFRRDKFAVVEGTTNVHNNFEMGDVPKNVWRHLMSRTTSVVLKREETTYLVGCFHGVHRSVAGGNKDDEKKLQLSHLVRCFEEYAARQGCTMILGGDFNYKVDDIEINKDTVQCCTAQYDVDSRQLAKKKVIDCIFCSRQMEGMTSDVVRPVSSDPDALDHEWIILEPEQL